MNEALKAQAVSMFFKVLPTICGGLVVHGVLTKDQATTLVNGAPDFVAYAQIIVGALGAGAAYVWSWWKNREAKRIADVSKIDGVQPAISSPSLASKVLRADPTADIAVVPK